MINLQGFHRETGEKMREWGCRGKILHFANNKLKGAWSLVNMHFNVCIINTKQYI